MTPELTVTVTVTDVTVFSVVISSQLDASVAALKNTTRIALRFTIEFG